MVTERCDSRHIKILNTNILVGIIMAQINYVEKKKILIAGYFGYGNTGDEAILESMIFAIRKKKANVEFTVFSEKSDNVSSRYDVKSHSGSIRKNPLKVIKAIKNTDLFILGGGGLLFDYYPLNLPFWLSYVVMAKMLRRPVMFYAIGIGPIKTKLGKLLTKYIVNHVDLITVRDHGSKNLLESLGVTKPPTYVTADPVIIFPTKYSETQYKLLTLNGQQFGNQRTVIGISVRPWFNSNKIKIVVAEIADYLITELNSAVVFIPMQYEEDYEIAKEIAEIMQNQPIVISKNYTPNEISGIIEQMDLIIGMRLHSLILAATHNVPIIGIIYDPKIEHFLEEINLHGYSINVSNIEFQNMINLIMDAMHEKTTIKKEMKCRVERLADNALFNAELVLDFI
jgi:polysaccharide pyruvyl transferase CsaB